jgi:hypothetical protein
MCLPFQIICVHHQFCFTCRCPIAKLDLKMHPYIDLLEKKMYFLRKCQVLVDL